MAGSIGTAYINIAPNMSGIQGKITSGLKGQGTLAGSQLGDEIGSGVSTKLSALSSVIAGATAAIVNKGLEVAGAAIKNFVDSASNIQSLRASFESLTGSVDATNKVMGTLYQFGFKTAFSNEQIQSAGRSFLAVGQDADQMQESLQLAGDVAGATGADLSQLVLPLSQAYARGTLQTQDFYQILNSGAGALRGTLQKAVEAKTGIKNLGDAMSQGKVSTDLVWEAMRMATKEGGFAFNGAIKQAETFKGRMSNLKETITNVGLGLLGVNSATGQVDSTGAFAKFSNLLQGLTTYLSGSSFQASMKKFGDILSDIGNYIAGMVEPTKKIAGQIGDYLIPKFSALWTTLNTDIIPILKQLWKDVIEPLIPVLGTTLVVAIGGVTDALNLLLQGIAWVVKAFQDGNPFVYALAGAFAFLAAAMAFNAIFDALSIGFATLTLITIPSAMASLATLRALISSPIGMGSIAVAGAIADIMLVMEAVNSVKGAINEMNAAAAAMDSYKASQEINHQKLVALSKTGTADQKTRANKLLGEGYANGTDFSPGGSYIVGEKGPEILNIPRGSQVIPNHKLGSMNTQTVTIGTVVLQTPDTAKEFFKQLNQDTINVGMGLSPVQGAYN